MISLLHVLDCEMDEYRLLTLRTLLDRLPGDAFASKVASTDAGTARRATAILGRPVLRADERLNINLSCGPRLRAICRAHGCDLLHAWGATALAACATVSKECRVVVSGILPQNAEQAARWLRQIRPAPAVIASGQVARSRMVELGAPPDRVGVIRGGVDFAWISQAKKQGIRQDLVGMAGPVVLLSGPVRRGDGSFETMWACAMLQRLHGGIRVVMPYGGAEAARLARLARASKTPSVPVMPGDGYRWPELLSAADMLVCAPDGEADTEPIAWAMAAGVPVIGVARRSIAELIADRSNGVLCRTNSPRALAAAILKLHEDESLRRKIAETARGQAYEVFSVRTFLDNYAAICRNLIDDCAITHGLADTAMVA